MWRDFLDPARLRQRLLALPTERTIALGRIVLGCTILLGVAIYPPPQPHAALAAKIVALAYVAFALGTVILSYVRSLPQWAYVAQHAVDIATTSGLTYLGDPSTFFMLFMFSLVVGLLRWNWRGALATACIIAFAILLTPADFQATPEGLKLMNADLSRAILRGGFVLVCGAMLAYLGAHRERSRRRFAQLAEWPTTRIGGAQPESMAGSLSHAAMVLQVPRVLVIYDETEEPERHVLLWDNGHLSRRSVAPDQYGSLVADTHSSRSFFVTPVLSPGVVDPALADEFGVVSAATAPINAPVCTGRVFMLDRATWIDEDLPVLEIIATRLGTELQDRILRRELEEAISSRERGRLGRDLHDGTLQGLAAASIQLRVLANKSPPEVRGALEAVREILASEAARIRRFVEASRTRPGEPARVVGEELVVQARELRARWGCDIQVNAASEVELTQAALSHLGFIMDEAVSNAVRHGTAKRVSIALSVRESLLTMVITDDGTGFKDEARPFSLQTRVEELGGAIAVASTAAGAAVTITLPL